MRLDDSAQFEAIVISDRSDLRRGRTIVMMKHKVLNGPLGLGDLFPPRPPIPAGLTSVNVQCEGGVARIEWTFQCEYAAEGERDADKARVYELEGSLSQEPITSHVRYADLLAQYGAGERDGEPVWLEKDPSGQSGVTGLSTSGSSVSNISPLYGVKQFLMPNAVYRFTKFYRTRGEIPSDLISNVGKIDEPEGLSESEPRGRFLKVGAEMQQMGDAYRVTEQWMASQSSLPNGLWREEIYG